MQERYSSLFANNGLCLAPIKMVVQKAERVEVGDKVKIWVGIQL